MSNLDIIRAWKDEDYRNSLSEAELAQLPMNPAGLIELTNEDLESVSGGAAKSIVCCGLLSIACSTKEPASDK